MSTDEGAQQMRETVERLALASPPQMRAAVGVILEHHSPRRLEDGFDDIVCSTCPSFAPGGWYWPCAEVKAIMRALGMEAGR